MAPWAFLAAGAAVVALLALPRERRRTTTNDKVSVRLPSGSCKLEDWSDEDLAAVQMKAKAVYGDMGSPPSVRPADATRITHDVALKVARTVCPDETWPETDDPVYKRSVWYEAAPNWQQQIWDLIWNTSWYVVIKRGQ